MQGVEERGMRRINRYAAVTRDEDNAADGLFQQPAKSQTSSSTSLIFCLSSSLQKGFPFCIKPFTCRVNHLGSGTRSSTMSFPVMMIAGMFFPLSFIFLKYL